jgi:hypothetical protein
MTGGFVTALPLQTKKYPEIGKIRQDHQKINPSNSGITAILYKPPFLPCGCPI